MRANGAKINKSHAHGTQHFAESISPTDAQLPYLSQSRLTQTLGANQAGLFC